MPWAGPAARQHQLRLSDSTFLWVEAGAGPPLVLLHGYGGSARWWERNLAVLAEHYHIFALDVPGFGGSRLRGPFSFTRAIALIDVWLTAMDLPAAVIMGHSMGGQLALLYAAAQPSRVQALVLLAPAGFPFDTGLPGIAWRALRSRGGGDWRFTPIVLAGSLRAGPRVMWQAVEQIRTVDVRREAAGIRVPTLILWGEADRLLSAASGPPLAAAIAGSRLCIVPGAGHNLMYDRPELVNQAARAFLSEVRTPRT